MHTVYCISGLGADHTVFDRVQLNNAVLKHLSWAPYDKHEDIPAYAKKLSLSIPDENPIILGLSFGGMMAVEIAKIRPVKKLLLVSSAKTRQEIAGFGNMLNWLIDHNVIPAFLFNTPNKYLFENFGAETEEEKDMLRAVLKHSDPHFMKWAMRAVNHWDNAALPTCPYTHIHGTADRIIPPYHIKPDYWIDGGSHIMIYNRAPEVNAILNKEMPT